VIYCFLANTNTLLLNAECCEIRWSIGPRFLRFITSVRVSVMPETSCIRHGRIPVDALAAYWYNNWALEKSGEIAMHSHLLPGAYAKRPLCEMLTPENIIPFGSGTLAAHRSGSRQRSAAGRTPTCV
jgi:hypothetical protein